MDFAFCVKDNHGWDAKELQGVAAKKPAQWLKDRRPTFTCRGCEQKVKFTDAKTRSPFFSVVEVHEEGCDFYKEPNGAGGGNTPGAAAPARQIAGNREVRYESPGALNPGKMGAGGGTKQSLATTGNQQAPQGPLNATTGLKNLLSHLRNGRDYPPATLYLHVPARGPAVPASDYLHKLADVTSQTVVDGVTRAYWGQISSAQEYTGDPGKETLWINCDNRGHVVTIRVPYDVKDDLYKVLGITWPHEMKDAHVIVEGVLTQGAKKHSVTVTDLKKVAFRPKR